MSARENTLRTSARRRERGPARTWRPARSRGHGRDPVAGADRQRGWHRAACQCACRGIRRSRRIRGARHPHVAALPASGSPSLGEPLTPCTLRRVLRDFLDSHADLSTPRRSSHPLRPSAAPSGACQRTQRLARVSGRDQRAARSQRLHCASLPSRAVFEHVSRIGGARAATDPGTLRRRFRRAQDDRTRRRAGLARQRRRHRRDAAQPAQHGRCAGHARARL